MTKIGTVKQRYYKCVGQKKVHVDKIYMKFWDSLLPCVENYHQHEGHPMHIYNCPIYLAARDYVVRGKAILKDIDAIPFVQKNCHYYNDYSKAYKTRVIKRLIACVESIRKHGYLKGEFKRRFPGLAIDVNNHFGSVNGYEIISGKHRIAAVVALGRKRIKCDIWRRFK